MSALNTLSLIIDITNPEKKGLLLDFADRQTASVPLFVRDDEVGVTLRFVQPSTTDSRAWDDVDLSADTVKLALGKFDQPPTAGTFTLTYGAETTTALSCDASAQDVQIALNSLSTIGDGGVTVTSPESGVYYVVWANVGTRTDISGTADGLSPASSIVVSEVVTGSATVRSIQVVQVFQDPYALTDTWTELPSADATVDVISAGSVSSPCVQRITLDPDPYAGTFQITTNLLTTAAIDFDASSAEVAAALNTGGSNYTVSGDDGGPWTISTVVNGAVAAFTVNASGLLVPVGLTGTLELSTYSMLEAFIAGDNDITLEMQCQVTPSGSGASTVLQVPVTASKDVINLGSMVPTPQSEYYTKAQSDARFLSIANAALEYQPLDADLTTIAGQDNTAYGLALLTQADAAANRATLGLGTAATTSASDYAAIAATTNAFTGTQTTANRVNSTPSTDELLNREQAVREFLFSRPMNCNLFPSNSGAGSSTSTSVFAPGAQNLLRLASAAAGAYAKTGFGDLLTLNTGGGDLMRLDVNFSIGFDFQIPFARDNNDFGFIVGTDPTTVTLSARGMAFSQVAATTMRLQIHDGSTNTTQDFTFDPYQKRGHFVMQWNAATSTLSVWAATAGSTGGIGRPTLIGSLTRAIGATTLANNGVASLIHYTAAGNSSTRDLLCGGFQVLESYAQ